MKAPAEFHHEFKDDTLETLVYLKENHIARMESHIHPDCQNPSRRFFSIRFIVENELILKEMLDYYSLYLFGHGARVTSEYKFDEKRDICTLRVSCDEKCSAGEAEEQLKKALAQINPATKHYRKDHHYDNH